MSIQDVHEFCLQDDPEGTYQYRDHTGFATEIKTLINNCSSGEIQLRISPVWHWGHSYVATFASERQALDFLRRKESTCAFHEIREFPIPMGCVELLRYLYPLCEHGMSESNCYGPDHYMPDHII